MQNNFSYTLVGQSSIVKPDLVISSYIQVWHSILKPLAYTYGPHNVYVLSFERSELDCSPLVGVRMLDLGGGGGLLGLGILHNVVAKWK